MPDLVPVEDNPFHVKLVPTDEQPDFADSLQGNFGTASQQLLNQEAQRRGVVGNVMQHFTLPGRIAQGVQPETPGVITEADAFRLNQLQNEAQNWAPAQAMNSIGSGMPMAEKMALGAGGGGIKAYHSSPDLETIVGAALRSHKGDIFSGSNHGEAFANAVKQGEAGNATENGFLTSTGRFVNREEALKIAEKSQPIEPSKIQTKDQLTAEQLTPVRLEPVEHDPF